MNNYAHQEREYWRYRSARARALLWRMRTGKTRSAVQCADFLFGALEIGGVLVIAPNGVHRQWIDEQVPLHSTVPRAGFAFRLAEFKHWEKFERWMMGYSPDRCHWLAVNMESLIRDEVQRAIRYFKKKVGSAMLIVDEAHHFSRPGAKRTAVARGLGRAFEYRRTLTGTESEDSPLQSFTQFEILERGALGHKTFGDFKRRYAAYEEGYGPGGRRFPKLAGYKNLEELKARKARYASVVLLEDCADLPPVIEANRVVELTKDQAALWRAIKKKEIDALEKLGRVDPLNGGAALVKLQQIEGGFWKRDDGALERVVEPDDNPKFAALLDELNANEQTLVWCQFVHEIDEIQLWLGGQRVKAGKYHGQMKNWQRDETLRQFRAKELRVLVAQPAAAGEGRDIPAAKIVWFSQTPSARLRSQAKERATAMGRRGTELVYFKAPGGVDEYFLNLTDKKTALADDMSRGGLQILTRLNV